jgi:RNA polymerase sigma-70 factor (ECF subfamily)
MLWGFLSSLVRDRVVAEELFQESLFTAWRTLDRYDAALPFGPWLRGIAGRLLLAERRKLARNLLHLIDPHELEALEALYARVSSRPGDLWEEKLDLLRRCLDELPEQQRTVIQSYYWDDLDCGAIAEKLARPLEAVKKRLQRARSGLAECMQLRMARPEVQP